MGQKISETGLKPKTVAKIIDRKMESWIKSIKNTKDGEELTEEDKKQKEQELKEFQNRIRNSYIVTGGAIASLMMGELPNDYDIYFSDKEVAKEVALYYINKLDKKVNDFVPAITIQDREDNSGIYIKVKSMGMVSDSEGDTNDYQYFESRSAREVEDYFTKHFAKAKKKDNRKYFPQLITGNAISLSGDIQIIIRFTGDPKEIHDNYDFVHATNYYTHNNGLVLNIDALTAIMSKELKYVGSKYPICSMFRIRKFIARGWSITAGELLKIAWDINKLDLANMNVFYEQLVGVDAAYFTQLIAMLEEGKKNGINIDRTYIIQTIDKVFNDDDELTAAQNEVVLPDNNDEKDDD